MSITEFRKLQRAGIANSVSGAIDVASNICHWSSTRGPTKEALSISSITRGRR